MKILFIVIEARKPCFKGWTLEYHGYLMAGHYTHEAGTTYTCIDSHPDTLHGGSTNKDGRLFLPSRGYMCFLEVFTYV